MKHKLQNCQKAGVLERCYKILDKLTGIDSHPQPMSETYLRISVAHLREVLESHFAHHILPSEIDEIINEVTKDI